MSSEQSDNEQDRFRSRSPPRTLLPSSLASLVSLATAASSLSLRIGGFVGHSAINAARVGTLSGVEVGRAILENVLFRAGQDVVDLSTGRIGKVTAEGVLESTLSALRSTLTQSSFLISAGFRLGSSGLSAGLGLSSALLSTINAILGDTETSKAIATIIVLIRHEIKTPGVGAERIGLGDALAGSLGFVLLQRWGWDRSEKALADSGAVETVWDVVILDHGDALLEQTTPLVEDVSGQPRPRAGHLSHSNRPSSFISTAGDSDFGDFSPLDDGVSVISDASSRRPSMAVDGLHPENTFKTQLSQQLKPGSSVRIATQSTLKNMVSVEVEGERECNIEPPSGYILVAVQSPDGGNNDRRRFIFQSTKRRRRRGSFDVAPSPAEDLDDPLVSTQPPTPSDVPSQLLPIMPTVELDESAALSIDTNAVPVDSPSDTLLPIKANDSRPRSPSDRRSERRNSTGGYLDAGTLPVEQQTSKDATSAASKPSTFKKNIRRGTSYGKLVEFWNSNSRLRSKKPLPDRGPPRSATFDGESLWLSGNRPPSPSMTRSGWASGVSTPRQSFEMRRSMESDRRPDSHGAAQHRLGQHRRTPSSVFSLKANQSETSLVLRNEDQRSSRDNIAQSLERNNTLPGQYPLSSFTGNVARFARFSVAAYGSSFIRFTGAATEKRKPPTDDIGPLDRHQSFTNYTGLPDSTVLVSSYVDPEGGAHMEGHADTGMPLIHYISLDHESKAVVLACRGTLGFEDILIDMTCDYDTFMWQGEPYQVHKGMLASARRLLTLHSGRIIATIKAALEEFADYGLVLCGHSLGGGVCSILGMMISQPNPSFRNDSTDCSAFITAQPPNGPSLITGATSYSSFPPHPADALAHTLPANRAVHVYAYGPAASVSPALSQATSGLVTTIVNNADVVPYLSLGNIRDFQSIALAFKHDSQDAKGEMRKRVWESLRQSIRDKTGLGNVESFFARDWSGTQGKSVDDEWPWIALESLREGLTAPKLLPPGTVFIAERRAVLQRFAFTDEQAAGAKSRGMDGVRSQARSFRPASHIRVTHVKDVARRFSELRFQGSMFLDHMPSRYERILEALEGGVT